MTATATQPTALETARPIPESVVDAGPLLPPTTASGDLTGGEDRPVETLDLTLRSQRRALIGRAIELTLQIEADCCDYSQHEANKRDLAAIVSELEAWSGRKLLHDDTHEILSVVIAGRLVQTFWDLRPERQLVSVSVLAVRSLSLDSASPHESS